MTDIRMHKLAQLLVNYSIKVKPGDWVTISGELISEPLIDMISKEVLLAGGIPEIQFTSELLDETRYRYASDEQLSYVSPLEKLLTEKVDAAIFLLGSRNTRSLAGIDPQKQQVHSRARRAMSDLMMERSATGSLRWVITQFPCNADAQEADMSLRDYEDFVYQAALADKEDPIAEWQAIFDQQERIIHWLKDKDKITVKSKNADLSLSVKDRIFINSAGQHNIPCGEVYTGPVENSANGWVNFTYPAIAHGKEVSGIHLEFKDGKVVQATAQKNEEFLISQLDMDEGSRYLGEFAIGTNYGINQFTKNILFDEKIGGSFHMAVGGGYPETGSRNKSSIHWDFICDMREDGEIAADGLVFYQQGKFLI